MESWDLNIGLHLELPFVNNTADVNGATVVTSDLQCHYSD